MTDPARAADAQGRLRGHRRFALKDVTLAGLPVGGATVDAWRDSENTMHWSARVVVPAAHPVAHGRLEGAMPDGRRLGGEATLVGVTAGPRSRAQVLAEFRGTEPLVELPPATADAPAE
jgi:hypothetical protein